MADDGRDRSWLLSRRRQLRLWIWSALMAGGGRDHSRLLSRRRQLRLWIWSALMADDRRTRLFAVVGAVSAGRGCVRVDVGGRRWTQSPLLPDLWEACCGSVRFGG